MLQQYCPWPLFDVVAQAGPSGSSVDGASILERWMESKFGLPTKTKHADIDMKQLMTKARLIEHFGMELWPSKSAVTELATQLQKCKFVASDLHKFLPSYCKGHAPVILDDELAPPWLVDKAGSEIAAL